MLEQAGVKDKEFELIQLVEGRKGMFHFGDIVDPVQHSGRNEPLNGLLKISCPAAFTDSAIHELLIGLGKLGNDAAEHHKDASAVDLAIVFGEIIFVDLDQFPLDL